MIDRLYRTLDALLRRAGFLCGIALFATTLITVADIASRSALGVVIPGASEMASIALAMITAWAIAACTLQQSHITIDILLERLPFGLRRLLRAVASAATGFTLAVIGYYGVIMTLQSFRSGSRTISELALPLGPLQTVWTAGLWVGVLAAIVAMLKALGETPGEEQARIDALMESETGVKASNEESRP